MHQCRYWFQLWNKICNGCQIFGNFRISNNHAFRPKIKIITHLKRRLPQFRPMLCKIAQQVNWLSQLLFTSAGWVTNLSFCAQNLRKWPLVTLTCVIQLCHLQQSCSLNPRKFWVCQVFFGCCCSQWMSETRDLCSEMF
jgi:hypothetical protein